MAENAARGWKALREESLDFVHDGSLSRYYFLTESPSKQMPSQHYDIHYADSRSRVGLSSVLHGDGEGR